MAKKRGQVSLTRRKENSSGSASTRQVGSSSAQGVTPKPQDSLTLKPQSDKVSKQRVNVYVDSKLPIRLDRAQITLKLLTGLRGHAVSQSQIVEAALEMALDNLDAHGQQSELTSRLLQKHS